MRRALAWVVPLLLVVLNGCGGSGSGGAGGAGGGGGESSGGGTSGGAAGSSGGGTGGALAACGDNTDPNTGDTCNTVEANGPCVTEVLGTGSPPAATGGQITAGTYDMTSRTAYLAPANYNLETRRETLVFSGSGNSFTVQIAQVAGMMRRRQSVTVTTSGTQLTFSATCPPPGDGGDDSGTVPYSANATSFTIFDMGGSGTIRPTVYTKR